MTAESSKVRGKQKEKSSEQLPSANWLALQKKLKGSSKSSSKPPPKKRRRKESIADDRVSDAGSSVRESSSASTFVRKHEYSQSPHPSTVAVTEAAALNHGRESLDYLRKMVLGQLAYSEEQKLPGKYLALDCEMVGVGPNGSESSLARVSLVNYHGAIILDEFVRQRERVTDYRTFVSGVRVEDMSKAIPFTEVQEQVDKLLKDRILVGHALNNDLKALLLSHPRLLTRDTQLCAGKARVLKTKYPALRKLVHQELGVTIQAGEHSSVTDARATMALYRLHRKEWDKSFRNLPHSTASPKSLGKRRAATQNEEVDQDDSQDQSATATVSKDSKKTKETTVITRAWKRGISSGLSTIVKRGGERMKLGKLARKEIKGGGGSNEWWSTLDGVAPSENARKGSKGSVRVSQ